MKKTVFLLILFAVFQISVKAQTKSLKSRKLNEASIVKDSSGMVYPYVIWMKMLSSGDYKVKALNPGNDSTTYLVIKKTEAEKDSRLSKMPKPMESKFFTVGEKIKSFNANDINGNKIKLKDLIGKVVVLNFWFIGCPPCRQEIPELNKLAAKYAKDPDVVFVAIALDQAREIKDFTKNNPFGYRLIDDGRIYADLYRINLFPTNLVLDKEGKVMFHAMGYNAATAYWINKNIEEAKQTGL